MAHPPSFFTNFLLYSCNLIKNRFFLPGDGADSNKQGDGCEEWRSSQVINPHSGHIGFHVPCSNSTFRHTVDTKNFIRLGDVLKYGRDGYHLRNIEARTLRHPGKLTPDASILYDDVCYKTSIGSRYQEVGIVNN